MSDSDTSAQRASSAVLRYGLAVSSIAAALIVTLLLHPDRLLSPVFFLAIMLSAWIGGIGAGLVAALLATMALAYFFLPPIYSLRFDPVHAPQLLVFFLSALLVSSWSATRRRAQNLLQQARDELASKVQERTADLRQSNEPWQVEIAERNRAEEVLLQQALELRDQAQLLERAHDAILVCDVASEITFWHRGAERMYGWTKVEALGEVPHTFLQTAFPRSVEEIEAALHGVGYWEGALVHTTRDGARLVVASRQVLQRDQSGNPGAILEINHDITGRQLGEEQLRRRATSLAEAQRRSHTGSFGWNVASGKILWSDETLRIFQYDRATKPTVELVLQRVHPDDAALVKQTIERASQDGKDCDSPDFGKIVNTLTEQPKTNAVCVAVNLMINVVSRDQPRGH